MLPLYYKPYVNVTTTRGPQLQPSADRAYDWKTTWMEQ